MNPQVYNFTKEDRISPVYCIGCRSQIPREVSNLNRGLCPVCIAKIQAPTPPPVIAHGLLVQGQSPPPPQFQFGNPTGHFGQAAPPSMNSPLAGGSPPTPTSYNSLKPPSNRMSPAAMALVGLGIALFVILATIIMIPRAKQDFKEQQQREQQRAREQVETDRKESQRKAIEARERAAQIARDRSETAKRGKKPIPSEWDGITPEVNAYLMANLKDYDSLKIVECSVILPWGENAWCQRVKYRAKNGFGGYNLEQQLFVIRNGEVTAAFDL